MLHHAEALPAGDLLLCGEDVQDAGAVEGFGVGAGAAKGEVVDALSGFSERGLAGWGLRDPAVINGGRDDNFARVLGAIGGGRWGSELVVGGGEGAEMMTDASVSIAVVCFRVSIVGVDGFELLAEKEGGNGVEGVFEGCGPVEFGGERGEVQVEGLESVFVVYGVYGGLAISPSFDADRANLSHLVGLGDVC